MDEWKKKRARAEERFGLLLEAPNPEAAYRTMWQDPKSIGGCWIII
jgi:hypothetical protein